MPCRAGGSTCAILKFLSNPAKHCADDQPSPGGSQHPQILPLVSVNYAPNFRPQQCREHGKLGDRLRREVE